MPQGSLDLSIAVTLADQRINGTLFLSLIGRIGQMTAEIVRNDLTLIRIVLQRSIPILPWDSLFIQRLLGSGQAIALRGASADDDRSRPALINQLKEAQA